MTLIDCLKHLNGLDIYQQNEIHNFVTSAGQKHFLNQTGNELMSTRINFLRFLKFIFFHECD
ncbi:hypothetical protein PPL_03613 [Heterostelium album PN500]|uniref:Uncharacterized protein n=1 Tax=Heterostelium pallidum (strain ATCC 26659 / Pp 5 / PN500) TaxID=670386 RepID=D3B5A0_HETP5|nr:hypothetical protein PPL_03613 [Heterostelium album PN500]EFA83465.1 hypothetical protein PPL_03613 [Heterostelium album PN500]|eukprot:XP_020435582.1 hypothetical protein PPL_03613 [Heterostelium album PN500]